ncbi:elongator complex protein 5 [Monosporozyma unispora]|nr:hypothetical protein C6P44_003062 [Kazachstania unispora]
MSSSIHNPVILLKRVLNLTESSSFILCLDTVAQTSSGVITEIVHHRTSQSNDNDNILIYVSFNSINKPDWATHFVDVNAVGGVKKATELIQSYLPSAKEPVRGLKKKSLIVIDSLNYMARTGLSQFIASIASPHATIVGTYHKDLPESLSHQSRQESLDNYPSALDLLQFMATTILHITPILPDSIDNSNELQDHLDTLNVPRGLNNHTFQLLLINRRKSGRSLTYNFQINNKTHTYDLITKKDQMEAELETPEMLQDLTTFNLSTSDKQKQAKDQVNLPFLEAQQYGSSGGAIVYEYEKDDDYDEEDPYEDPF